MLKQEYSLPKFDDARKWIRRARDKGITWENIMLANKASDEELQKFLDEKVDEDFWTTLNVNDWKSIVELEKEAEERMKFIHLSKGIAQIYDPKQDNAVRVPEDEYSCWQLYKSKLLNDGFKQETVDEIEAATLKILKRLSADTTESGPIKGLVIGNVQSGKTANMAALMAMAADWGWNLFIVLSGTIENLRRQTQTRLFNDLNNQGMLLWRSLEHLSKNVDISFKSQSLHFGDDSKERYFTVCLKNQTRLKHLIQWCQVDANVQRHMKVLVIDDEADQAGINTGNVENDEEERKRINRLICALVNGNNEENKETTNYFKAMNYIGYTATPYANILNESKEESLYPKNFISTLAVSKEYFGPQQIFGYNGDAVQFEGLDIVRIINENDLDEIKTIHDGDLFMTPKSLIDAVTWFMCGVCCMRIWGYKKPISMLVHTSQKTAHHQNVAYVINNWISKTSHDEIISRVKRLWEREKNAFSLEKFQSQYPDYDRLDSEINSYPSFEEIKVQLDVLLRDKISNIKLDDEGDLSYHRGIHLCIDNCMNNGVIDGMHVRLAYPNATNMPDVAPAFIVVGGATLSRGLTLEGLISTFFIRSVSQADTLMQMGRWFGYRRGYELLPRIWLTKKTREQFKFLAALDQELRDEIQYMDVNGRSPAEYGPKVKNSPKVSFIRVTAKNKMQSAQDAEMDYSGASNQTYLFDNDETILKDNLNFTMDFLGDLGDEWIRSDKYKYYRNAAMWKDVPFKTVRDYLEKFHFQERLSVFNDTKPLLDWIQCVTEARKLGNWNVVVAGKKDDKNGTWILPNGHVINKVRRSKLKSKQGELEDTYINIGVLRDPRDLLIDIDIDSIKDDEIKREILEFINSNEVRAAMAYRDKAGLETTPQLLIYCIDKDSKAKDRVNSARMDLDAKEDLIGLCIYIPGGRSGTSYASTISIKMKNEIFDGDADLEGVDAD